MKICVMDVGHGLCMPICVEPSVHILVDCGNGRGRGGKRSSEALLKKTSKYICKYTPKYFILSHFHYDHYNGILYMAKKGIKKGNWFDKVYLPGIPPIIGDRNNKLRDKFTLSCLALNLIQTYRKYDISVIDVLDAINKINGQGCKPRYCFEEI